MIMGFDWADKKDAKVSLWVVPVYSMGEPDIENALKTEGGKKAFPYPDGKIAKTALLYVPGIPGQPQAVLKLQPAGIPNTLSKLLFVLSAVNAENEPVPVKQAGSVNVWCAIPVGPMDIFGANGKLEEFGLSGSDLDSACCVPFEMTKGSDNWVLSGISNGYATYRDIVKKCGFIDPKETEREKKEKEEKERKAREEKEKKEKQEKERKEREPNEQNKQAVGNTGGSKSEASAQNFTPLIKGQKIKLDSSVKQVTAVLAFKANFTPDISAFILDGQTRPKATAEELIFYNQPSGANGAITYDIAKNALTYDLSRIPSGIERIVIVLSTDEGNHFGKVQKLSVRFLSDAVNYIFEPDVGGTTFTAIEIGEVYRKDGIWRLGAKGTGCNGGLAQLCEMYGVEVE
jgi:stress response protein SCP2